MYCELKLDFKCALAILNDEKRDEEAHQETTIYHFYHLHQLTRCIFLRLRPFGESLFLNCYGVKKVEVCGMQTGDSRDSIYLHSL
ncbi:hypothetical protein GQ457_06G018810 [Hibiscus cannabinus]